MNDRFFLDSNVLVYCFDGNNSRKQNIAQSIVSRLVDDRSGQISTQSLQEFFNVATKKLRCTKEIAKNAVEYYADSFPVHTNTVNDVLTAINISIKTQFSFYDSLIIAAAQAEDCTIIYSEDLNDGQMVGNVQIINPFK